MMFFCSFIKDLNLEEETSNAEINKKKRMFLRGLGT